MRAFVVMACLLAGPAFAQDRAATLADVRQDLTVLYQEIQKLKVELSTTSGAQVPTGGDALARIGAIESELQRLTAKTEELEFRINRVVKDGTNRVADLEFRLIELEGGDVSQMGQTTTLGGETAAQTPAPAPQPDPSNAPQVAVGEQADFARAVKALEAQDFATAVDLFAALNATYPGGPYAVDAEIGRGDALSGLGDAREGARAYLAAYNLAPDGARAPEALLKLGRGLQALEQVDAACQILAQLSASFPDAGEALEAQSLSRNMSCS